MLKNVCGWQRKFRKIIRKNGAGLCVFDWIYLKEAGHNSSNYLLIDTDDKLSPLKNENESMQPDNIMKPRDKILGHAGKEMEEMP